MSIDQTITWYLEVMEMFKYGGLPSTAVIQVRESNSEDGWT